MPRKEYKTISVKIKTFQKFIKSVEKTKKTDPKITNSEFLNYLLNLKSMKPDQVKSSK